MVDKVKRLVEMMSIPLVYDDSEYPTYKNSHLFFNNLFSEILDDLERKRDELLSQSVL